MFFSHAVPAISDHLIVTKTFSPTEVVYSKGKMRNFPIR